MHARRSSVCHFVLPCLLQMVHPNQHCPHTSKARHLMTLIQGTNPTISFCTTQDLEAGPIKSVHFSKVPKAQAEGAHTLEEDFFSAPDFVVGSRTGSIVAVRSGSFEETSSDVPAHRLLVQVWVATLSMHSMAMCLLSSGPILTDAAGSKSATALLSASRYSDGAMLSGHSCALRLPSHLNQMAACLMDKAAKACAPCCTLLHHHFAQLEGSDCC